MSKLSAITSIPISSQMSICHDAGMLWAVRIASHPMSFRRRTWRRNAARLNAAPSGPRSWCRHTPLNFRTTPLSRNPSAVAETVRMPKRVVRRSRTRPATTNSETSV